MHVRILQSYGVDITNDVQVELDISHGTVTGTIMPINPDEPMPVDVGDGVIINFNDDIELNFIIHKNYKLIPVTTAIARR